MAQRIAICSNDWRCAFVKVPRPLFDGESIYCGPIVFYCDGLACANLKSGRIVDVQDVRWRRHKAGSGSWRRTWSATNDFCFPTRKSSRVGGRSEHKSQASCGVPWRAPNGQALQIVSCVGPQGSFPCVVAIVDGQLVALVVDRRFEEVESDKRCTSKKNRSTERKEKTKTKRKKSNQTLRHKQEIIKTD